MPNAKARTGRGWLWRSAAVEAFEGAGNQWVAEYPNINVCSEAVSCD